MEHALLLALTCAAAALSVSYVDYSGVKMPQYDGNVEYEIGHDPSSSHSFEDYNGHSPDAAASLDYKYEEEPRTKTEKPNNLDDSDMWRQPVKKHRQFIRSPDNNDNLWNKYGRDEDVDEMPILRTNRRYPKHRSRLKNEIDVRDEQLSPRHYNQYSRDKEDVSDIDRKDYFHIDKYYIPDDKNKEFDEDIKFWETTSKKQIRKRHRNKQYKRQQKSSLLDEYEEVLEPNRPIISDTEKEDKDDHSTDEVRRQHLADHHTPRLRYRPVIGEEEDTRGNPVKASPEKKQKVYDEYEDYSDMKRVHNIKNKLPTLLRRTTVRGSATNTNLLGILLTHRIMVVTTSAASSSHRTAPSTTSSTAENTTLTRTTSTFTTTASTTSVSRLLAEKSRLSILKNVQRKKGISFNLTIKPPVLLQVTNHIPTVVMVEPPSPSVPWMPSRKFGDDSPEQIEKAKRLMRHKLMAEAKSIHELTNNWDEMVCDYIDTSLLESKSAELHSCVCYIVFFLQLFVFVINL